MKKFFKGLFWLISGLLHIVRAIMVIGMIVIGTVAGYLVYTTATMTIDQYNETLTWENTAYETPLAEIEPALVSNVVDTDIVTAASAWEDLEKYVAGLTGEAPDREEAQAILDEAVKWQEKYNLKSDAITRLSLYLDIEDAIAEAYETLDTTELQSLTSTLYTMEMEETTAEGQYYMGRVREVASDFANAQYLVNDVIGSVGTVENGVWTIPYTYTREDLAGILEQINTMQKFPSLANTANTLSDVADVLNSNKNAREYMAYENFLSSVSSLDRSDFTSVSSIYTYGQALEWGLNVSVHYAQNFTISEDSKVTGIYYNGTKLAGNKYIRRNASGVTVEIEEIYEPITIITTPVEDLSDEEIPIEEGEYDDYE